MSQMAYWKQMQLAHMCSLLLAGLTSHDWSSAQLTCACCPTHSAAQSITPNHMQPGLSVSCAFCSALHKLLLRTHEAWAHLRIRLMRACLFDLGGSGWASPPGIFLASGDPWVMITSTPAASVLAIGPSSSAESGLWRRRHNSQRQKGERRGKVANSTTLVFCTMCDADPCRHSLRRGFQPLTYRAVPWQHSSLAASGRITARRNTVRQFSKRCAEGKQTGCSCHDRPVGLCLHQQSLEEELRLVQEGIVPCRQHKIYSRAAPTTGSAALSFSVAACSTQSLMHLRLERRTPESAPVSASHSLQHTKASHTCIWC